LIDRIFIRFPNMQGDILEIVGILLREQRDNAKSLIEDLIESE